MRIRLHSMDVYQSIIEYANREVNMYIRRSFLKFVKQLIQSRPVVIITEVEGSVN